MAGLNQSADESAALRVGGAKDVLGLGATWRLGLREFVGGRAEYSRFHGQDGTSLGNGMVYDVELGYRIRTAYPNYTVRLVGTHGSYNTSGGTLGNKLASLVPAGGEATPAFYMPQSFTQAGVTFGFGTELIDDYTRKWRPFAEVGLLHDTRAGQNFRVQLGVAGRAFGNDHLSMYVQHETAARNGGTPLTQVGMLYKWLFNPGGHTSAGSLYAIEKGSESWKKLARRGAAQHDCWAGAVRWARPFGWPDAR
ncbi:hypothetical protein ACU4GD_34590 [Cupriavidus basilensis]